MANQSEFLTNAAASGFLGAAGVPLFAPIKYQQDLAKEQKDKAALLDAELKAGEAAGIYDYNRPQEAVESLNTAKMLSTQGLPSAQRQAAEQDIMRSQNFAVNASTERGGGLNSISNIQQSTGDMYRNLANMDAQARMQNIQNLQAQQAQAAAYADKEWEYNVYQPFMRKVQSYQDLTGASIQNRMGALNQTSQLTQQGISLGMQAYSGGMLGGGGQNNSQSFAYTPQNNPNFAYTPSPHVEMVRPTI